MGKVTSFIMGGLVGACAALAFAPRTGAEARAAVAGKAAEVKDDLMGMCGQSPQQVYHDAKTVATDFVADATAKGHEVYTQATGAVQDTVSGNAGADELREKIEAARARITDRMMANIEESREAAEPVEADADELRVEIEEAAEADIEQLEEAAAEQAEQAEEAVGFEPAAEEEPKTEE